MKPQKMSISAECQFGFCTRCSDPQHCSHSCRHKKPQSEIEVMVNRYNEFARSRQLKPGYINLEKATSPVLHRAARVAESGGLKDVATYLKAEAKRRETNQVKQKTAEDNIYAGAPAGTTSPTLEAR
jgi:hypothetical protein